MHIPAWLRKLLTVDDSVLDRQFNLQDPESAGSGNGEAESADGGDDTRSGQESEGGTRKPIPMREYLRQAESNAQGDGGTVGRSERVPGQLAEARRQVQKIFHLPQNKDIVIRDFTIGTREPSAAFAVFIDGMADKNIINSHILEPLMLLSRLSDEHPHGRLEAVKEALLPGNQIVEAGKWEGVIAGIVSGSTAVFVDGCDSALIVESKGWEHRAVSQAQTENVVRGAHDAFTESFRANTGLVRSRLRSEHLITEMLNVGRVGRTDVAIMYIHGLTNPHLVNEVRRRIEAVDVDYLADSGALEQFIEDNPRVLVPQMLATERPDRVAHMLMEGHVAIFVGHNPYVLVAPVVFWTLMHSPEDAYLRFPYGSFLRLIRWIALVVAVLMPSLYVGATNYHPEMIPTDLMLAIAGSREAVPFPVLLEVLLMEFSIELIREAGIRIPSVIGPTIGIVGALIIGQAAVQAGIVSPLLVIVVATTALASFSIPNYNLGFAVRLLRFLFLLVAAVLGFYGITLGVCLLLAKLAVQKSFGVPLLAPVAPSMEAAPDVTLRAPAYTMNRRPSYLRTQSKLRQDLYTRDWSAVTTPKGEPDRQGGEEDN